MRVKTALEPQNLAFLLVSFAFTPTLSHASSDSGGGFFSWNSSKKNSAKKVKRLPNSAKTKKKAYESKSSNSKKGKLGWGAWESFKPGQ